MRKWLSRNSNYLRRIASMICFIIAGLLTLIPFIREKRWQFISPFYLVYLVVFLRVLYFALCLFFLIRAIVGIVRDEKVWKAEEQRKLEHPEEPASEKIFRDEKSIHPGTAKNGKG